MSALLHRFAGVRRGGVCFALAASLVVPSIGGAAAVSAPSPAAAHARAAAGGVRLWDGRTVQLGPDGIGSVTSADGRRTVPFATVSPRGHTAFGDLHGPTFRDLQARFATAHRGTSAPGEVVVALSHGTLSSSSAGATPAASDAQLSAALRAVHATGIRPMLPSSTANTALAAAARTRLGAGAVDLGRVYVVTVDGDARAAAARLAGTPGVVEAMPNFYVSPMSVTPQPLPSWTSSSAAHDVAGGDRGVPTNYGVSTSYQSYLNTSGVDAVGAFAELHQRFGQLPGADVRITNVSVGDLTDAAMARHDPYVRQFGPTTVIRNGQRYLDVPSMPLIPTYVADPNATLDPLGSVEGVDPYLGEVLLDFSVMAPLPHQMQRHGEQGSGPTDLLGIAPGADYRLVVPQQATFAGIGIALLAAATQTPRPDVITASLGYGFDVLGFPGRYLEDDPILRTIVAGIVQFDGVVVCISANDGTRLYTPAAIGPDGGSAATDLPGRHPATSVNDDGYTSIASRVPDSGAIAVGGSTNDDILSVPPSSDRSLSDNGAFPETRTNGGTYYSSGFGTRIDVSAPSDNIPALEHGCLSTCDAHSVIPVLNGGTSASAPMVAAAAAVVLQAGRLSGTSLTPDHVRAILEESGRQLPNPPQIETRLQVGPQLDVKAALDRVLGSAAVPDAVRLSVAHRQELGSLGAAFVEATDPTHIDLQGPPGFDGSPSGQNSVSPITFGLDTTGTAPAGATYVLRVGAHGEFTSSRPFIRLLPAQVLGAAGLSLQSDAMRDVPVQFEELVGGNVVTSARETLHFSASTGAYVEPLAPWVAPVQQLGRAVAVHYDIRSVRGVASPQLVVSSVGHWSPVAAPNFRAQWTTNLTAPVGTVMVPASVFEPGGAGIYGVAVVFGGNFPTDGEFASFRIAAPVSVRAAAPTLAGATGGFGHEATVTRQDPRMRVRFDVRAVPGATGAAIEVSPPGPALYGQYNTFNNPFGSERDANGGDSPSALWLPVADTSGTLELDPGALGLQSSLLYTVRVMATANGKPVGEASPYSFVAYDDTVTPGDAPIVDFDISPAGTSSVATVAVDGSGNLGRSAVTAYDPTSGGYGDAVARTSQSRFYRILGSDPQLGRIAILNEQMNGFGQRLDIYDTSTGQRLVSERVSPGRTALVVGGRVDPVRDRVVLLAWRSGDYADELVPFDLRTNTFGPAVRAHDKQSNGTFTDLDIDRSTGKVVVTGALYGDTCIVRPTSVDIVDLDARTATKAMRVDSCPTGIASDQHGGAAYLPNGPLFSFPSLFPVARMEAVSETDGHRLGRISMDGRSPFFPVVDPVHHLALVAFVAGADVYTNNDAMSAVGVIDLATGQTLEVIPDFNLTNEAFYGLADFPQSERGLQVDPATRTGYTFGPFGDQIERFHY